MRRAELLFSFLILIAPAAGAQSLPIPTAAVAQIGFGGALVGPCQPEWIPTFGGAPYFAEQFGGSSRRIFALASHDDGSGAGRRLYAAGHFVTACGAYARRISVLDGEVWRSVGDGFLARVNALCEYDDGLGGGPRLFATGFFGASGEGQPLQRIAAWDGSTWAQVGSGLNAEGYAMAVHDDGSGPRLFVAGAFTDAGGVLAARIAAWDGTSWSALRGGLSGTVHALAVHDDGGGPALFAGGLFALAGGQPASNVAKWDGFAWSALGAGVGGTVLALASFDDGGGPALFAGGAFATAGGGGASHVARWNGTSWSALGLGTDGDVRSLAVYDDGSGAALFAGGSFANAGGAAAGALARWQAGSWSAPSATLLFDINALHVHADPGGGSPRLHGASDGGVVYRYDGTQVERLVEDGINWYVRALHVHDDGDGWPSLFVGGRLTSVGDLQVARIAKWNVWGWSALGSGLSSLVAAEVNDLESFHDGHSPGPALFAVGFFDQAGGVPALNVARWGGGAWSGLGSGLNGRAQCALAFDDGSGPALYVGGEFTQAGGAPAARIARWNGTQWSSLGGGFAGPVQALAVHDDGLGGGPALYAAGPQSGIVARWDGSGWTPLGAGLNQAVYALASFDDGSGPRLYAGGFFTFGAGQGGRIARWNGVAWEPVGAGFSFTVSALLVHDDGSGPALYAGGGFQSSGSQSVRFIARWDGTNWLPLGSGTNDAVSTLAEYDDGTGSGTLLLAGGTFASVIDSNDSYLGRWGGCAEDALGDAYCFGDGGGTPCPCSNAGGPGEGCANGSGRGARLWASGSARVSTGELRLRGAGLVAGQAGLYLQGNNATNGGAGVVFGDGLRCAGGGVVRLQVRIANALGLSLTSLDVAARGGVAPGDTRTYQIWYRDVFTSPCGSGFNLSNGLALTWSP